MIKSIVKILLIFFSGVIYSQSFTGNYFVGEQKVTITIEDNFYYIIYEDGNIKRLLQYEENTPENDQIWLEWQKVKQSTRQTGTLVFKQDYSGGIYTDYRTGQEFIIKKRD